jgi:hypothetical protein
LLGCEEFLQFGINLLLEVGDLLLLVVCHLEGILQNGRENLAGQRSHPKAARTPATFPTESAFPAFASKATFVAAGGLTHRGQTQEQCRREGERQDHTLAHIVSPPVVVIPERANPAPFFGFTRDQSRIPGRYRRENNVRADSRRIDLAHSSISHGGEDSGSGTVKNMKMFPVLSSHELLRVFQGFQFIRAGSASTSG